MTNIPCELKAGKSQQMNFMQHYHEINKCVEPITLLLVRFR